MNQLTTLHPVTFPELTDKTGFDCKAEPVYMQRRNDAGDVIGAMPIPGQKVIRRTDNGAPLGVTGKAYTIAHNRPLYDVITGACRDTMTADKIRGCTLKEYSSFGGSFTRFELAFPGLTVPIYQRNSETEIQFKISVINGFAGNSAIRVLAGAFDLICTNGMYLGEMDKASLRHTASYDPRRFAGFIEGKIRHYVDRCRTLQAWAGTEIEPGQFEQVLIDSKVFSERRQAALLEQFKIEAANRGPTIWAAYSAATFYSSHNSDRFTVRGSGSSDNVAATLTEREAEVSRLIDSPAWAQFAGVAA